MRIVFKDGSGEYDINTSTNDYYSFTRADGSRGKALKAMEGIDYDLVVDSPPTGDSPPDPVSPNAENTVSDEKPDEFDPIQNVLDEEDAAKMSEEELEELTKPDESVKESE